MKILLYIILAALGLYVAYAMYFLYILIRLGAGH
jgi:hypothetical protein